MKTSNTFVIGTLVAGALTIAPLMSAQLSSALDKGERAIQASERIQAQINQANTDANDLVREYRDLLTRRDSARVYASQQKARFEGQLKEIESLEEQLSRIDLIVEEAAPMMADMIDGLDMFIRADLPFKLDQRLKVVDELRALLETAKVTDAERYRKIVEAYLNELQYGRTVQTWSETVDVEGSSVEFDYFLFGRVSLVRMNEMIGKAERWSRSKDGWVSMPSSSLNDIKKSIRIAEQKAPPEVMMTQVEKFSVR